MMRQELRLEQRLLLTPQLLLNLKLLAMPMVEAADPDSKGIRKQPGSPAD